MTFTTYMRRLTASIAALSLVRHGAENPPQEMLEEFGHAASAELEKLAESVISNRPPEPMPELPTPTRTERKKSFLFCQPASKDSHASYRQSTTR